MWLLYSPPKSESNLNTIVANRMHSQQFETGYVCYGMAYNHKEGTLHDNCYMLCHVYFRPNRVPLGTTTLFSSLWRDKSLSDESAQLWWKYIFDKAHSPWRSILRHITPLYKDDLMVAFRVDDLNNLNAQVFLNFLVATRMPREQREYVNIFNALYQEGYTRYEALCIGNSFTLGEDLHVRKKGAVAHYFFNDFPSIEQVKKGTPVLAPKVGTYFVNGEAPTGRAIFQLNTIWNCDQTRRIAIFDALKKRTAKPKSVHFKALSEKFQQSESRHESWELPTFLEVFKELRPAWNTNKLRKRTK